VLARAFLRRGTELADAIAPVPGVLVASQVFILAFELFSPVVFVLRGRARYLVVGFFYLFHAMTIATITISFLPHQVAMAGFLPIERIRPLVWLETTVKRFSGPRLSG
jgi:hypothetical protein